MLTSVTVGRLKVFVEITNVVHPSRGNDFSVRRKCFYFEASFSTKTFITAGVKGREGDSLYD